MRIDFKGANITDTDYFGSRDWQLGIPWCLVHEGTWHVLIPRPPIHPPSMVECRPVTDSQERDGWRWRLELPEWHLALYERCLSPKRPRLPEPMTSIQRRVVFYHAIMREEQHRGSSFFGTVQEGMQIWASCPLWILRGKERRAQKRSTRMW